ncbi:uncharacterized protein EV154DRAFT_507725 [Mucor mucedo]|uniref:uncharacterized protein n=1 Tax=Mucor mucedo TaxID=29922 RepID=UPI00221F4A67|nr:uncharacterized protein EV154DRAFT_507725 [Mucor mucedo]KAI7891551.1 hypothetical protein EV154DRAFT_507725 [Mucor mucedo]
MFLDGLEKDTKISSSTKPTPILLSSPYQIPTETPVKSFQNNIHINSLLSNSNNMKAPTKKYPQKRMSPYSPASSSSDEYRTKKVTKTSKKTSHELLSDDQKKANHIASEQKRRANIRIGFEKLIDIVPTLSSGHRSEALILQKSVEHLRQLVESKTQLKERARELQLMLGDIPDEDSSEGEIDYDF